MEVVLSSPRGFCAGVVRAIDVVELCLQRYGSPIYVKHQIVHNPYVVAELESKGAITVEDVAEIPARSRVVFSAHGSAPEDFERAKARKEFKAKVSVVFSSSLILWASPVKPTSRRELSAPVAIDPDLVHRFCPLRPHSQYVHSIVRAVHRDQLAHFR